MVNKNMTMKRFTFIVGACLLIANPIAAIAKQDCKPDLASSTPTQRFNHNDNGTLSDTQTGLMWKTCLEGQRGGKCKDGSPERMQWQIATNRTQLANQRKFAGYSDWRLPTLTELKSIIEQRCMAPASNLEVFPNMQAVNLWSGSQSDPKAWSMDFTQGKILNNFKGAGNYVRLVRNSR
ncbi:Lcl C-terminal domain-containing protein [Thiothrix lacustris]|uniref:Lcl C-terminal domain-containing protein n=1 Tax=Thiothrix lacustris TaxID=525917 RepID=UPI0027E4D2EA|nr:DUF1566 domain-containing protein [Thiothrix lacustris]WMP16068.1 DUF1566 domain-containing protein [Thiothrix lacustris]